MEIRFEQNLSSGFKVWNDIIELERSRLRSNDEFQEAYKFVSDYLKTLQVNHSSNFLSIERKIKKQIINLMTLFFPMLEMILFCIKYYCNK